VKVLDTTVRAKEQAEVVHNPVLNQVQELIDKEKMITENPRILYYRDGFEKEA